MLVETIGTGQSETMVADMTDFFLVLMLPGAGDELQGLKKGVVEIADIDHRERMTRTGEVDARRREQQVKWMWAMLEDRVFARLRSDSSLKAKLPRIEAAVTDGRMSPAVAVDEIAAALGV